MMQEQYDYSSDEYTGSPESEVNDEIEELFDEGYMTRNRQCILISQYVTSVIDVSSQYGNEFSISYTAYNLTGRPSKYPDYGDFPETFAMRTYGKWWDKAPSGLRPIMPQTLTEVVAHDYLILQFEEYVFPHKIVIYETYNPGALIRIWAYTANKRWIRLWSGEPELAATKSRAYAPPIRQIYVPTRIIRLEFNHSRLDYFTEIDAVMLVGRKYITAEFMASPPMQKGPILKKLESCAFRPVHVQNHQEFIREFFDNELETFVVKAGIVVSYPVEGQKTMLQDLPCEILLNIFQYLDLVSLFRVSQTCRKLHNVALDPLLYREVNLSPYWHIVDSKVIQTLTKRCKLIQKLDLSWCGIFDAIVAADFNEFITLCGSHITHLRLNSVKFLNATSFKLAGLHCKNLQELSIRNCPIALSRSTLCHFKNLDRLDLFRTTINIEELFNVLKYNPKLKHLNLGFCGATTNMDSVAIQIAKYNQNIESIDMWKSHVLSSSGLMALSKCSQLQEVDFGWCLREEASPGESLKELLKGCPKLKKIFLASIRGLTDRDLDNITTYCKNLEQLDLMGVMGITGDKCLHIIRECPNLKLIDLNFCEHLDDNQVELWKRIFNVCIKRTRFVEPYG